MNTSQNGLFFPAFPPQKNLSMCAAHHPVLSRLCCQGARWWRLVTACHTIAMERMQYQRNVEGRGMYVSDSTGALRSINRIENQKPNPTSNQRLYEIPEISVCQVRAGRLLNQCLSIFFNPKRQVERVIDGSR